MALILEEAVSKTGKRKKQIVNYDITGRPGNAPEDYKVTLLAKTFFESDDGLIVNEKRDRYTFKVGSLMVDSKGKPIEANIKLLTDFMGLFYAEMEKVELKKAELAKDT